LSKGTQPVLFECIQQAALEAFETSPFKGGHMGCDIELQVTGDGVTATSVDCRPMSLLQPKYDCRDTKLVGAFPGGLNALINVFIANFSLHGNMRRDLSKVAACYDAVAPVYDEQGQSNSHDDDNFKHIVQKYEFDGHVVDVACGTGFFGRVLKTHSTRASFNTTSLVGFDLSPGMAKICRETGLYDQVYVAGMQSCLLQYHGRDQIDHVVCFGAVHFLTPEEFGLFLVQCFVIANRSITIAVDEIPDSHNMRLRNKGMSYMHSINHLANMKNFGEPEGWRLVSHRRRFSWNSPTTGDDVYSTFFRFERMAQKNILMTRIMEKN
jgi:SAM-dependent methyltransferase